MNVLLVFLKQVVQAVSISQFSGCTTCITSFQQAVANCLAAGTSPSAVYISSSFGSGTTSITVNYGVVTTTSGSSFSSVQQSFTVLNNNLQICINSGYFTAYLRANAINNNAVALSNSYSTSATVVQVSSSSSSPSSSSSSLSSGGVAGVVITVLIVSALVGSYVAWYFTRKTIVVAGLPPKFSENDLMVSLPGAVAVRRLENMVCAYVEFETHAMAAALIERSNKELIYFKNSTLVVRFAMPGFLENVMGPPTAPPPPTPVPTGAVKETINPAFGRSGFGVRPGTYLDQDLNM